MNREILLRYGELKIQEKKIADELKMLKDQAQKEVESVLGDAEQPLALTELPGYSFTLAKMPAKWEYSPSTKEMIKTIEDLKKNEEADGSAVNLNDGKKTLKFNQPKAE